MAILQISKIQQRSGNLVDLPQLDDAEFGWASDAKRLFIGKTTPNENIEILTSYSTINFSQINGTVGNLNISNITVADGQVLTYDGSEWVNRGGNAGGLITLGDASNVKITGGAIGYVLETDGLGNLSWTPKGTLYTNIVALSNATPIVMTVANTTPYSNDMEITISGVQGNANANVNGQSFYIQLSNDYPTSGNVELYTGTGGTGPVDGTGLTYTNSPNAIATTIVSSGGSSSLGAAGATTQIQYNETNILQGNADFTWNNNTGSDPKILTVNGNANVGNLNATGTVIASILTSNITTGTAPLTVTSTTRVANLNVATSGSVVNGNSNVNIPSANGNITISAVGNANIVIVTGTGVNVAGTLNVTGNANVGNLGATNGVFTNVSGNGANLSSITGANVTGQVGNALVASTVYTNAQPNITSVGTLTSVAVTGNANVGNLNSASAVIASTLTSNVATGTAPLTVTSTTRVANLSVNYANVSDFAVVTAQSTGTYYPVFVSGSSTANYALAANSGISANLANGSITATTFVGNVSGNISGTLVAPGANTQVIFNDSGNANATSGLTFNKSTNVLTVTANVIAGNIYANSGTIGASLLTGTLTTAAQPNITSVGTLSSLSVSGNISGANLTGNHYGNGSALSSITGANVTGTVANATYAISAGSATTAGTVTTAAQPNITSVGTLSSLSVSGALTTTQITAGANSTAGNITGNWTLTAGSRLQATYADLAEFYEGDATYDPGTVLMFGGEKEVTIAEDGTNRVAGVVSTNPAYLMNSDCPGNKVAIALQGRVPCKVRGKINKGDMLVSGGNGFARPNQFPTIGSVIGKALENFDGYEGVIEIAVGRL